MLIPHAYFYANAAYTKAVPAASGPTINDPNLKAELVFKGLKIPTSMTFLGPNNILVLEKNSGNVLRILDGNLIKKTTFACKCTDPIPRMGSTWNCNFKTNKSFW